tara:strand:- start:64 stop:1395 length:1332 start_codon:yes stop_codon:yes gene_type:complete
MRIKIKEKKLFKKLIKRNFNFELNSIDSFCIDSRLVQKNDIFMPIKGNHINPHHFISEVLIKNPAAIFSEKEFKNNNIINVNSTKKTLNQISKKWIKSFKQPTIAITGSNGKTTTKEMLMSIFKSVYTINHTKGNYNSSIGLPINLFNFSLDAEVNIIEMGANKPKEINGLCQIIRPDYGLITNIHSAHIGNFKSFEELLETKLAIFKNTSNNGKIFENNDDINISQYCKNLTNKISFGFKNSKVDFFGKWTVKDNKEQFSINGKKILNPYLNKIMAHNMLASYSISSTYGINHQVIIDALRKFNFVKGRGRHINKNGYLIIDDTYNANFESFKIGIESFMNMFCKGRKVLVIGDMKELGLESKKKHINLGEYINKKNPDLVFSFGELIFDTTSQLKNKKTSSKHFTDIRILIDNLKSDLIKGDAIYFKASRSLKFENIIKAL